MTSFMQIFSSYESKTEQQFVPVIISTEWFASDNALMPEVYLDQCEKKLMAQSCYKASIKYQFYEFRQFNKTH